MKQFTLALCASSILFFSCNNEGEKTDAPKTDPSKTEQGATKEAASTVMPDSATRAKNWQAYRTPGEMHKMMEKWNGNWDADATFWAPDKPEMKSKSSATNKMFFNGLYQETAFSGDMMGMPFVGKSTTAYDNHKKKFITSWIDNMGSGMMVMEGPWDEATKTMNLKGKIVDPETGYEMEARQTFKMIDDNTQELEMFLMLPDGKEFKMMNIKFTRKK